MTWAGEAEVTWFIVRRRNPWGMRLQSWHCYRGKGKHVNDGVVTDNKTGRFACACVCVWKAEVSQSGAMCHSTTPHSTCRHALEPCQHVSGVAKDDEDFQQDPTVRALWREGWVVVDKLCEGVLSIKGTTKRSAHGMLCEDSKSVSGRLVITFALQVLGQNDVEVACIILDTDAAQHRHHQLNHLVWHTTGCILVGLAAGIALGKACHPQVRDWSRSHSRLQQQ